MKKLLLISLLFSSCYTAKKANNQVVKAQSQYPDIVASNCAKFYPVKEKIEVKETYIKGKDSIIIDTVEVDCNDTIYKDKIVKIPIVKEVYRVDTFLKIEAKESENTALASSLRIDIDKAKKEVEVYKYKDKRNTKIIISLAVIVILLLLFLSFLLRRRI